MSNGKHGFRIRYEIERPSKEALEQLSAYSTPNICDGMSRFGAMEHMIKPLSSKYKIVGPAITVKVRPGDNLMLHKAIDVAQSGDILVVDTSGCYTNAVLGELICMSALEKKLGGIVVDGAVRDVDELLELGFPVFAKAVIPTACDKDGPGEINYPISCGGIPVNPGDIIVGDVNGVAVVPQSDLAGLLPNIEKKLSYEARRKVEIKEGVIVSRDIDKILSEKGVL
ncbi:MAG: RraA family protein [Firmicutes bacterium]|nr:RraA family protein [Bacillota bacterium]NSW92148.1 RraA family protein [Bacillota bacterium]